MYLVFVCPARLKNFHQDRYIVLPLYRCNKYHSRPKHRLILKAMSNKRYKNLKFQNLLYKDLK